MEHQIEQPKKKYIVKNNIYISNNRSRLPRETTSIFN